MGPFSIVPGENHAVAHLEPEQKHNRRALEGLGSVLAAASAVAAALAVSIVVPNLIGRPRPMYLIEGNVRSVVWCAIIVICNRCTQPHARRRGSAHSW